MKETPDTTQRPAQPVVATGPLVRVTIAQWCTLCDAEKTGHTSVHAHEVRTARALADKGLGRVFHYAGAAFFEINSAGRSLLHANASGQPRQSKT